MRRFAPVLILFLLLGLAPCAEAAAPVFENQDSGTAIAASILTLSGLTVSSSANRVLVVGAYLDSNQTVTGITWQGTALTFVAAQNTGGGANERIEVWRLIAPAAASPGTITITASGSSGSMLGVATSYKDANQTTPLGTPVTTPGNDAAPTTTVSSASDDTIWALFGVVINTGLTITGGQTNRSTASTLGQSFLADDKAGTGGNVTESYSTTSGFRWASIGVAIKAVGGGGATPVRHKAITQ